MGDSRMFGTVAPAPGEMVRGELPIPVLHRDRIKPPSFVVIRGGSAGPVLYVGAGAHGDEFNAIEAVRRATLALDPRAVRGTIIFVPVQNIAAFEARTRCTPADDRDMDTCYPGDPDGSPSEVLAHALFTELVTKADYALDLHTATRAGWNLLHALTAPDSPRASAKAQDLARAFGCRVIITLEPPAAGQHLGESLGWNLEQNLFVQATARGIPTPIIEFGEGGRMEADQVELGLRGILRVLEHLKMLEPTSSGGEPAPLDDVFVTSGSTAIRATTQGLLHVLVRPGTQVRQGELLARVISLSDEVEEIHSNADGLIVRVSTDGVVTPGDRVVVLATS
jgi:uncharacterized protein